MNLQNRENAPKNTSSKAAFGIDCVIQKWQNTANVPAAFAKTVPFNGKYLAGGVKTNLAPDPRQRTEGRQSAVGGPNG